jgi:acyl-CoA dehydrogenase
MLPKLRSLTRYAAVGCRGSLGNYPAVPALPRRWWRIADRAMQVLGGLGITDDTIVARIFREVRPFRIYDGPPEVHRWSIAQRVLRSGGHDVR